MILQDNAYIYIYIILSTFVLINYYYFLSLFSSWCKKGNYGKMELEKTGKLYRIYRNE